MSFYRRSEVMAWLETLGCSYEGETFSTGLVIIGPDGIPFTMPDPEDDGWLDADLVDDVLANRWIPAGPSRPRRRTEKA